MPNRKSKIQNPKSLDVRAIRTRLGLSQEEFARKLGTSWRTVSRWEQGQTLPNPMARRALDRLAKTKRD